MTFIENLVTSLAPQVCQDKPISIISLTTTNPVYLVFIGNNRQYPELVVSISSTDELHKTHKLLESIYRITGDLVPQPIAHSKVGGQFVTIQKGLQGKPWFQLAGSFSNTDRWNQLRNRSFVALNMFHQAIKARSEWQSACNPGIELQNCLLQCLESGTVLSKETRSLTKTAIQRLEEIGEISVFRQHGDFCLNNLIISEDKVSIIDFEDFGLTSMPFHDHFTLALSLHQLSPKKVHTTLQNELKFCINETHSQLEIDELMLTGFFMHHLLLRLGSWSQSINRKQFRARLLSLLQDFTKNHTTFFCA